MNQWPEDQIESIEDIHRLHSSYGLEYPNRLGYIFRGQSKAMWTLHPTLARVLGDGAMEVYANRLESELSARFVSNVPIETVRLGSDVSYVWSLMQHHGAPTRLLDWTRSIYIATYFAARDDWTQPGAVWMVSGDLLDSFRDDNALKPFMDKTPVDQIEFAQINKVLWPFNPDFRSERVVRQKSVFTICTHPLADHADVVASLFKSEDKLDKSNLHKFIIEADRKPALMKELLSMNITAETLVPGHDGVGRTVSEMAGVLSWLHQNQESQGE